MLSNPTSDARTAFRVGDYAVDPTRDRVTSHRGSVALRPKVMDMLVLFAQHPKRVFTVTELLAAVWPDTVTSPASVYNCLRELRAALGDDPRVPQYIETIPKRGYRLIAPVSPPRESSPENQGYAAPLEPRPARFTALFSRLRVSATGFVVLLGVVTLSALFGWWLRPGDGTQSQSEYRFVAVLPLKDLSEDGSLGYLAEGLARAVIDDLSTIPSLRVIAYESSFRFRDNMYDIQSIGQRLGADLLLSGTIRKSGYETTVSIHMTEIQTGQDVWSYSITLPTGELYATRSRLGSAVAAALQPENEGITPNPEQSPRPLDTSAYDLFLKARRLASSGQKQSMFDALELLEQVQRIEPGFGNALALSLDIRWRLFNRYGATWPEELASDLTTQVAYKEDLLLEAGQLVQAYPVLAEAHLLQGRLLRLNRRYDEAEKPLQRALELNASMGEAHRELGWLNHNLYGSWTRTIEHFREAVALSPDSVELKALLVRSLSNIADRREEMWQVLEELKRQEPWSPIISMSESTVLASVGRYANAIRVLENVLDRVDNTNVRAQLADLWYALDRPDRSRQLDPDYESWRSEKDEQKIDPVNRCPRGTAGLEQELLLWSAYVCAERRRPELVRELLASRYGNAAEMASDPGTMPGSEFSMAILMAWALKSTGDPDLADHYAQIEKRVIDSRSENGTLQSGKYFMLKARLAAIRGDTSSVYKNLEAMLTFGHLNPRGVNHAAFDEYRSAPRYQLFLQRRAALVQDQLKQLGLPAPEQLAPSL